MANDIPAASIGYPGSQPVKPKAKKVKQASNTPAPAGSGADNDMTDYARIVAAGGGAT